MDMRRLIFTLICCHGAGCAAHDFWVQPGDYWPASGAPVSISLQVGHGPDRQRSQIPMDRITRFVAVAPSGEIIDLRANLRGPGTTSGGNTILLTRPGTYLLVLETDDRARSFLPALRFNDYLRAEGLLPALEQRARLHRMDTDGSENYSRRSKAIVQVGPGRTDFGSASVSSPPFGSAPSAVSMPLGLSLEIVPEIDPYAEPRPPTLPVRVIYAGQLLPGALVKLTNLENDAAPLETHLTDSRGRAVFAMPPAGKWLLNVIWTKPQPQWRDTDFDTAFSSLSFALPVTAPAWPGISRALAKSHRSLAETVSGSVRTPAGTPR
jgi:uncharacterized GH25 family protein